MGTRARVFIYIGEKHRRISEEKCLLVSSVLTQVLKTRVVRRSREFYLLLLNIGRFFKGIITVHTVYGAGK